MKSGDRKRFIYLLLVGPVCLSFALSDKSMAQGSGDAFGRPEAEPNGAMRPEPPLGRPFPGPPHAGGMPFPPPGFPPPGFRPPPEERSEAVTAPKNGIETTPDDKFYGSRPTPRNMKEFMPDWEPAGGAAQPAARAMEDKADTERTKRPIRHRAAKADEPSDEPKSVPAVFQHDGSSPASGLPGNLYQAAEQGPSAARAPEKYSQHTVEHPSPSDPSDAKQPAPIEKSGEIIWGALAVVAITIGGAVYYVHQQSVATKLLFKDFNMMSEALERHDSAHKQWMTDASHELRTPLAVLRAQVEALQDGVQQPSPKTFAVLHKQILALTRLVDDLHDLAKYDVGKLTLSVAPTDVAEVLEDVVDAFHERYREKNLHIELEAPGKRWIARADAVRLKQLFSNLLENSYRYTNPGGKVQIQGLAENGSLFLNFDDSPPGVPEEALAKLFERFYRSETSRSREHGGSGLGLAICQTIVRSHGGSIRALPSPLGGVRVSIQLPLIREVIND